MSQTSIHPIRVQWNPRMSSKRLNDLLNTPNIHVDDEDAILGELWLRDSLPYGELSCITPEEMVQLENLPNGEPFEDVGGYCRIAGL